MTTSHRPALHGLLASVLCASMVSAAAAPGAHGPNGEHLDAPGSATQSVGLVPRFEARSELFELVGRLQGGELSLFINRFATNEPVLNAKVELESGAFKSTAQFHSDAGDYAVADEAFLEAVSKSGDHPIVVTVVDGNDADLLEGTLTVAATGMTGDDHGHEHGLIEELTTPLGVIGGAVLLAAGGWFFARRRNVRASRLGGPQ